MSGTPRRSAATKAMQDSIVDGPLSPILFDYVTARGPEGIKFDVWHGGTHVPSLSASFPLGRIRRYAVPARASYLMVGELAPGATVALSPAPAYPEMVAHAERFIGEPVGAKRRRDVGDDIVDAAVVYPAFLRAPADRMDPGSAGHLTLPILR